MSETLHLECARAQGLLALHVDGDLGTDDSAWLRGHLTDCAEVPRGAGRVRRNRQRIVRLGPKAGLAESTACGRAGRGLLAGSERLPRGGGRCAGFRRRPRRLRRDSRYWRSCRGTRLPVETSEQTGFVEIPYLAPPDPHENTTVVRIQIRVATLIAVGYRVTADPDAIVPADVLVGEDGRAHAVRVPADVGLNGTGD